MNDAASFDLGAGMIITVFVCLFLDGLRGMVNEHRARKAERLLSSVTSHHVYTGSIEESRAFYRRLCNEIAENDHLCVRQLIESAHSIPPPLPDLSGRTPDAWPL